MFLKSNKEIFLSIDRTTTCQDHGMPILMAIAYWGKGADEKLKGSHEYKIICNLTDGGTNPSTIDNIRKMKNVELKHLERLHAKVVIGSKYTIVGSANFSENGLGYGSATNAGQYEAALQIATEPVHSDWFDELWNKASIVSDNDISKAFEAWLNNSNAGRGTDDTYESQQTPPKEELLIEELLEDEIKHPNKMRMATSRLERRYIEVVEPEKLADTSISTKRAVWNPAHAANFIWVMSGNSVEEAFSTRKKFESTLQVFNRMESKGIKTTKKVLTFLVHLAQDKSFSKSLRYWAQQSVKELERLIKEQNHQ
ncbi:phospholipase D family protein [Shewanella baltica]|uniref:phospholipase D family protein n=1 Tax=Shewanella baltica TaxID=62322 RepID=UPI000F81F420|nr:phospholipase D family protein [Shewanella baltica]